MLGVSFICLRSLLSIVRSRTERALPSEGNASNMSKFGVGATQRVHLHFSMISEVAKFLHFSGEIICIKLLLICFIFLSLYYIYICLIIKENSIYRKLLLKDLPDINTKYFQKMKAHLYFNLKIPDPCHDENQDKEMCKFCFCTSHVNMDKK